MASEQRSSKILVDADACPVKNEIASVARNFNTEVWMVASYAHELKEMPGVRVIQVDRADQAADLYIANQLQADDVLITQDFGLAVMGLSKRAVVLSNYGQKYTDRTIDFLLDRRHSLAKRRRSGQKTKGPKPFTNEDRQRFQQTLTKVLQSLQEKQMD